jgi:hypothetical protein
LPTLWECATSAELLAEIVAELAPELTAERRRRLAAELFAKHGGDLRAALREIYDQFAGIEAR